jgi:hypothetical protein
MRQLELKDFICKCILKYYRCYELRMVRFQAQTIGTHSGRIRFFYILEPYWTLNSEIHTHLENPCKVLHQPYYLVHYVIFYRAWFQGRIRKNSVRIHDTGVSHVSIRDLQFSFLFTALHALLFPPLRAAGHSTTGANTRHTLEKQRPGPVQQHRQQ